MDPDVVALWGLISGLLLLLANCGVVLLIEGLTRRRRVFTVSARHLAGVSGAVFGSLASGRIGLGYDTVFAGSAVSEDLAAFSAATMATLFTTVALAALAERATVLAHGVIGALVGAVLLPAIALAQTTGGVLGSISIGGAGFIDTSAASFFMAAGSVALIGTMVIGPRLGVRGPEGEARKIPGKSMPTAMVGALLAATGFFGLLTPLGRTWESDVADGAVHLLVGAAVGVVVGALVGTAIWGRISLEPAIQGMLAGLVTATADPFSVSMVESVAVAAVGSAVALAVVRFFEKRAIDDPLGSSAVFGIAGMIGSLGADLTNGSQVLAQFVGVMLLGGSVLVAAGFTMGLLRLARLLRVRPDIEVVGLDL